VPAFTNRWLDRFADVYETTPLRDITWFTGTAGAELIRLVVDGRIARGDRVVDLGCGPGIESLFLAVHGMRVTGVDRSPHALAIARQLQALYGVDVTWLEADILDVPLDDGVADVVNDSFIFHNVREESRGDYASEVFRLLRPGGLFVLRGYSEWMSAGSGPIRLRASDIVDTFSPGFECEHLSRFLGLPTEKRPEQWHWLALWRRRQ